MWILQSAGADTEPVTFRVAPGTIKTVGRAPRADFIVDAALVSRVHCRLEVTDDRIDVIDLASTNGTFVNGKRVERARMRSGDLLQVGRVALKVSRVANDN
jgi:pSer/pThr/pTyr-binding forkhead associated (FHA) protein